MAKLNTMKFQRQQNGENIIFTKYGVEELVNFETKF